MKRKSETRKLWEFAARQPRQNKSKCIICGEKVVEITDPMIKKALDNLIKILQGNNG